MLRVVGKSFPALLASLLCFHIVSAQAGGRIVGNGAGGLVRKGQVLTYGSARIPLHPVPALKNLPGLQEASEGVGNLKISGDLKSQFLAGLLPTGQRQYFLINPDEIDPVTYRRLLKVYGKISSTLPAKENQRTVLLAITSETDTYLLPDFFKIEDRLGQAAILFHEALWVINPKLTPEDVVHLEMAFEDELRAKNDVRIYYEIATRLMSLDSTLNGALVINAYIQHDLTHQTLGNLTQLTSDSPSISLESLFGNSLSAHDAEGQENQDGDFVIGNGDSLTLALDHSKWALHLEELSARYPGSLLLLFFAQNSHRFDLLFQARAWDYSGISPASLLADRSVSLEYGNVFAGRREEFICDQADNSSVRCQHHFRQFPGNVVRLSDANTKISLSMNESWLLPDSDPTINDDITHGILLDENKVDLMIEPSNSK